MSRAVVDLVKQQLDIVQEIQRHVKLTKKGQNYVGLCPFHNEKSPSFYVSPVKKIFHCFGCGESGDVLAFIMKYENISFKEVVIEKANELNISHDFSSDKNVDNDIDKIRDFLNALQLMYIQWIQKKTPIIDYCFNRGLSKQSMSTFGIGYADSTDIQIKWLKNWHDSTAITKCGLFKEDFYPLLSNRLIFPIHNPRGIIVGFSGRALDKENKAKYINSPESYIFSKKKILYGMHIAKKKIKELNSIIIVEGFIDVITLHQHGFENVVAVMGTALTANHVQEIAKYCQTVQLLFDSDKAGRQATLKSIEPLQKQGLNIEIISINAKDPGEFFEDHDTNEMSLVIKSAKTYMDHFIESLKKQLDPNNPAKKSEYVMHLCSILKREKKQIIVEHYAKIIAETFEVSENIVNSYLQTNTSEEPIKRNVNLKTESKVKKAEDVIIYSLISSVEFRRKKFQESVNLIKLFDEDELKILFEKSNLVDYELIDKINHLEIKKYLLSLVIKFSEYNFKYESDEMEGYFTILNQSKIDKRISEIRSLLSDKSSVKVDEKDLLLELSTLIKKIK